MSERERIDQLRVAIDEAVEQLNLAWGDGVRSLRLSAAVNVLQTARTNDDIANGRDWHPPIPAEAVRP